MASAQHFTTEKTICQSTPPARRGGPKKPHSPPYPCILINILAPSDRRRQNARSESGAPQSFIVKMNPCESAPIGAWTCPVQTLISSPYARCERLAITFCTEVVGSHRQLPCCAERRVKSACWCGVWRARRARARAHRVRGRSRPPCALPASRAPALRLRVACLRACVSTQDRHQSAV